MPYRKTPLVNGEVYHIFNRGVAKLPIFHDKKDWNRLKQTFCYYQFQGPKPQYSHINRLKNLQFDKNKKIVEILCYCLMPNHFHFMVRQVQENGISEFVNKLSNSYTKYFNTRHKRVGPLLQGQFKAVRVETDEQLLHLSRYIHLNPTTAYLVENLEDYYFSSYHEYTNSTSENITNKDLILNMFKSPKDYQQFVMDQKDYARTLKLIEHQLLE